MITISIIAIIGTVAFLSFIVWQLFFEEKSNKNEPLELEMLLPPNPTPQKQYMKAEPGEKVFKYGSDNPSDHLDGSTHFSALTTTEFDNYDVG